jgi:hypothetical protein
MQKIHQDIVGQNQWRTSRNQVGIPKDLLWLERRIRRNFVQGVNEYATYPEFSPSHLLLEDKHGQVWLAVG